MRALYIKRALLSLLFILLTCLYTYVAMRVPINSDSASPLLIAKDVAAGNIFLQGWSLSTVSFYFTEILPYAVAIKLFGWHLSYAYVIPALMLAAVVLLTVHLSTRSPHGNAWPVLVIIATPGIFAANLVLVPSIHMGAYLLALLVWVLLGRYREQGGKGRLALACMLMAVTLFSDDIAKYFLLLPLCLTSVYFYVKQRSSKDLMVLLAGVVALIISKLIGRVFVHFGGFEVPGLNVVLFSTYEGLATNIDLVIRGFFTYFDADFFGMKVMSFKSVVKVSHAVAVFGVIYLFARLVRRPGLLDFNGVAWALSVFVMLFAYAISQLPVNLMTTRYLVPVFIFGTLLVAYNIKLSDRYWYVLAAGAVAYGLVYMAQMKSSPRVPMSNGIVQELQKRNLTSGYATFWNASNNAFMSGIHIPPVFVNETVVRRDWLSKKEWYQAPANFLIVDTEQEVTLATASLGAPDELLPVEGRYLMVWNKAFSLR